MHCWPHTVQTDLALEIEEENKVQDKDEDEDEAKVSDNTSN